jgi:hypothetical protein
MRAAVVIGGMLVAGGAIAAAYGATRPVTGAKAGAVDPDVAAVEQQLEARLAAAREAIAGRREMISALDPVRYVVAADVTTLGNLNYEDLKFTPAEREVVELGQRPAGGGATAPVTSLGVLPATAPRSKHLGEPGPHLGVAGGDLILADVGTVAPAARQDEVSGVIAVSMTLDLSAEVAPLRRRGIPARIDTPDGPLILTTDPAPGAAARATTLGGMAGTALVTAAPPAAAGASLGWLLWAGIGGGALGLLLLGLGLSRPRAAAPAPLAVTQTPPPAAAPNVNPHSETLMSSPASLAPQGGAPTPLPRGTRGSAPMPLGSDPAGGPIFGRYQLVRKLGTGGMADVYLARAHGEAGFSKAVALKLLHSHLASRPQVMAHFLDEARLASNLNHPNIVHVIDLGKVEADYYIAMEYVDGSDLERVVAHSRASSRFVPMAIAMTILRRVCDGLDAAHRAVGPDGAPLQLVHRDVKSGNVLVSRQGQVKISDFGIAKASSQVHTTQIGETKGTPSVMAPEQRMGQQVDARADVYSVAALGYELFTSAEMNLDLVQLAQLGIEGWPHLPPPSEVRADLPRELDAVLLGALAFQPDARPSSCHELEEQLAQIAARYGLACTDKDIARWLDAELAMMPGGTAGGNVSPAGAAGAPPSPPPMGLGA